MNEEKAREILGEAIQPDGSLGSCGWEYIDWKPGQNGIILDGGFGLETLEAIVWWMQNRAECG